MTYRSKAFSLTYQAKQLDKKYCKNKKYKIIVTLDYYDFFVLKDNTLLNGSILKINNAHTCLRNFCYIW